MGTMNAPAPQQNEDDDIDVDLLDYLQTLTVAQRVERHEAALELVRALRKAGTEHYGFDPRAVVAESSDAFPSPRPSP
jgi:hypothetical protein